MKTSLSGWLAFGVVVLGGSALATGGCSSPERKTGGTGGGEAGTIGNPPVAGANGTGFAGANGSGTGGTDPAGAAGSTPTGTAGSSNTGAAGTTGAAGSGTSNTLPATFNYLFDTSVQGWALNKYADTSRKNLADPASGATPTLAFDATSGDPAAGSLKATATFTDWKQYINPIINLSPAKSLPGRVLRARVKLLSGNFTGGAQLHAGTGSTYKYAASAWKTITGGQWVELLLDLDAAHTADAGFDPTMVVQIGVRFDSGGDGGTSAFGSPVDAVFQIDTVSDGVVGGGVAAAVNFTFDADKQGFALNDYANPSRTNLAAAAGSTAVPVLTWDSAAGNPSAGSLQLAAMFSAYKQYADVILNLGSEDLTGKTLHAFVKLDSGLFTGGATLHAGLGPDYTFAGGAWTTLNIGDWIELTLDLTGLTNAGDVRQIGVQFDTGDPEDAGTFGSAVASSFHVDSFTVTP
jgi:hypothetical protein